MKIIIHIILFFCIMLLCGCKSSESHLAANTSNESVLNTQEVYTYMRPDNSSYYEEHGSLTNWWRFKS